MRFSNEYPMAPPAAAPARGPAGELGGDPGMAPVGVSAGEAAGRPRVSAGEPACRASGPINGGPPGEPRQNPPFHPRASLHAERREDRRSDVHETDRFGDPEPGAMVPGGRSPAPSRRADDQGDMQGGLVQKKAVSAFAVLAEPLAVIGSDDHQGPIEDPRLAQAGEEPAQLRVHVGDLPVVRARGEGGVVRRRRLVRRVRIEQVRPEKEPAGPVGHGPVGGARQDLPGAPLLEVELPAAGPARHRVVVGGEPLVETELVVQNERPDERPGGEPLPGEDLRDGLHLRRQPERAVRAHAVPGRGEARHDRRVRDERDRRRCDRVLVDERLSCEGVEDRGPRGARSIAAEVIGAQGVDRHEDDLLRRAERPALPFPLSAPRRRQREEGREEHRGPPGTGPPAPPRVRGRNHRRIIRRARRSPRPACA